MKGNILKRIISIILASFICTQSIFAEGIHNVSSMASINEEQTLTTITVGDITGANPGDTIAVPVSISNNGDDDEWNENNTGLIGLHLNFKYDANALTYRGAIKGAALPNLVMTNPGANHTPGDITFLWDGMIPDNSDGVILNMRFTVTDAATSGNYAIDATVVTAVGYGSVNVQVVVSGDLLSDLEIEDMDKIEPISPIFPDADADITTNQTPDSTTNSVQLIEYNVTYNIISSDGLNVHISYNVYNGNSESESVALISSLYEGDRLSNVKTQNLNVSALQSNIGNITLPLPNSHEDCKVKLMVWDGYDTLKPIGCAKEVVDLDDYSREKYMFITSGVDASFSVYMNATTAKGDNKDAVHLIKYDPTKISPVDLCGFTYNTELTVGEIENTDIIVQSVDLLNGKIECKFNLEAGRNTGITNLVKFKTLSDVTDETIVYTIQ